MKIALGIDTGGTYTDAVLLDQASGTLIAATKALTTHRDLALGIEAAIDQVFAPAARLNGQGHRRVAPPDVSLVGLSTTLATNAIVEGHGGAVCLILIGYDRQLIRERAFEEALVTDDVVYLEGGHTIDGREHAPLDEAAAHDAILARQGDVAAFAISGYFGVRNPAHELRVKALVETLTRDETGLSLPVTCGHELTTKLNAIRRATTVALNARLIPTLRNLILTVRQRLDRVGIVAPLMVVKGDGSLVRSAWAVRRPIETILSGPAASVVGAAYVAEQKDVWIVDVGGTTTDIAVLRDGVPRLNAQGAQVGRWRTMVEAADVHTVGLGGDSQVWVGNGAELNDHSPTSGGNGAGPQGPQPLSVGPRRVLPLCRLSEIHSALGDELRRQRHVKKRPLLPLVGQFLVARRPPGGTLAAGDRELVKRLQDGPVALIALAQDPVYQTFLQGRINRLVETQLVMLAGFTPTDALHALGRFQTWDAETARLGAELLAAQLDLSPKAFCEAVVASVSHRIATELVTKIVNDEIGPVDWATQPVAAGLLSRALNLVPGTDLSCRLTLRQPVVAVGAPVTAYVPAAAERLNTELILPHHAGVANAIGAVVGSVVQRALVLIRPIDFGAFYRLHLPGNLGINGAVKDFDTLEACIAYAENAIPPRLRALAEEAGAHQVEVQVTHDERTAPVGDKIDEEIFLEARLTFTAAGRPATAVDDLQRAALQGKGETNVS